MPAQAFSDLLRSMSMSPTMIRDEGDRGVLALAAEVVDSHLPNKPMIQIVSGTGADPIEEELFGLARQLDEIRDAIGSMGDEIECIHRHYRRLRAEASDG